MPRWANVFQIPAWWSPSKRTVSATRIALRMSRNDGLVGASSIARVTSASLVFEPSRSRSDQRVCAQISPSPCTSGDPTTWP